MSLAPENPVRVEGIETIGLARDVLIRGKFAYVAAGTAGLKIFDLAVPGKPLIGEVDTIGSASGISVQGDLVYLSGDAVDTFAVASSTLTVVDISNPVIPVVLSTLSYKPSRRDYRNGGSVSVLSKGSLIGIQTDLLTQDGEFAKSLLQILDIGSSGSPKVLLNANLPEPAHNLTCVNGNFVVANGFGGLRTIPQQLLSVDSVVPTFDQQNVNLDSEGSVTFSSRIHPDSLINPGDGSFTGNVLLKKTDLWAERVDPFRT